MLGLLLVGVNNPRVLVNTNNYAEGRLTIHSQGMRIFILSLMMVMLRQQPYMGKKNSMYHVFILKCIKAAEQFTTTNNVLFSLLSQNIFFIR